MKQVVVFGGTGPSGYALVERLLGRGDEVTIVHTGSHERDFSGPVEHLHCDTRSQPELAATLGGRDFDVAISTSGLLRAILPVLAGRVGSLAAVTGLPAYAGWQVGVGEAGFPLPLREGDPPWRELTDRPGDKLSRGVIDNEAAVYAAAASGEFRACVLRYTMVYGPWAYIPFEWYFVRRVLDGRTRLALEGDGLMLPQRGWAENLAEAVLVAVDDPRSNGRAFNVGDEQVLSVRAIAEIVAAALGHRWEVVGVPMAASPCRNPFAMRQNTMMDLSAIRGLGYRDVLPVTEATGRSAVWLAEHPVAPGSSEECSLGAHAFDYAAEDAVLAGVDRLPRIDHSARPEAQTGTDRTAKVPGAAR